MRMKRLKPYAYLAPALLTALAFVYLPFLRNIVESLFLVRKDRSLSSFVGLDNYWRVLADPIFWQSLGNTLLFMVLFVPLNLALILAAVLLTEREGRANKVYEVIFMLPMAMGMSSMALIFKYMFRPSVGIVNRIIGVDIPWTNDALAAMFSVVFLGIALDFGLDYLLLLSALRNIDKAPIEAARLDGASEWQLFWRIKAPLLGPTLFFVLFISMKDALLICAPIMVMTEGGPFRSTQTIVYQYYIEAFRNSNWSAAAAISTLVFVMAAVITILSMRFEARRLHYEN